MKGYLLYVLIVALLCVGCSANKGGKSSDTFGASVESTQYDITDSTTTSETIPEPSENVTAPTTTQVGDYILDGTKLIGYIGDETELTLPAETTAIAAYAFRDAPSAARITSVHLGAKVTEIEAGAFTGMHSLCTFTVDSQNPQFYAYEDHTLVSLDGTLYMGLGTSSANLGIGNTVGNIEQGLSEADKFTRLVIAGCEFDLDYAYGHLFLSSFHANGQNVIFDDKIQIEMNHTVQIEEVGDGSILSVMYYDIGDTWFLTTDGVIEFKDGLTSEQRARYEKDGIAEYNYSAYRLYNRGDGKLGYKRILQKYNVIHYVSAVIEQCVNREEFYQEIGTANIIDGKLEFIPVAIYSVSEKFDIDEDFRISKETGLFAEYSTLDELLAANAEKYERGY